MSKDVPSGVPEPIASRRVIAPHPAERQAQELVLSNDIFRGRSEARGITIDPAQSRDLDDAIWLEKAGSRHILHISIADVGAVVRPESLVDNVASERVFTRYLAHGNDPMLPHVLSEDRLTLSEAQKRPTITISIEASNAGLKPTIRRTFLQSQKRFHYDEADRAMRDPSHEHHDMLRESYSVARSLLDRRRRKGAIIVYDSQQGLGTNEEGLIERIPNNASHLIVQEFMIAANEAVASYFAQNDVPGLFRNHTARPHAPEREDILKSIDLATNNPGLFDMDFVGKNLALILNRATYGPRLYGHFGLNLPAYMHFTSPIRRYPDLINQRQLTAALQNENPPYTRYQLDQIATTINDVESGIKDGRRDHFREQAAAQTRRVISQAPQLAELGDDQFHRVLKVAGREGKIDQDIEAAIRGRLAEGKITPRDIFTLLFEATQTGETSDRLNNVLLSWLQENTSHGITILTMGSQAFGWETPVAQTTSSGPDHARTFTSVYKIRIDGQEIVSDSANGSSQKLSQQRASIDLLAKVLQVRGKTVETPVFPVDLPKAETLPPRAVVVDFSEKVNYKGLVQEISQKNQGQLPVYNSEQTGEAHSPTFTATAQLTLGERTYISDPVVGRTKKEAEQMAAASLMKIVENVVNPRGQSLDITPAITINEGNFVGGLLELCQKMHMKLPNFAKGKRTPDGEVSVVCSVKLPDGKTVTYTASGSNEKEAKQRAAEMAFTNYSNLITKSKI